MAYYVQRDRVKREFLAEWVQAVNQDGRFGIQALELYGNPGELMVETKERMFAV